MDLRHIIDFNDLTEEDWNELYNLARDIKESPERYSSALRGKVMATLFYEPSTRTQFSFQAAILRLGGSIIGFADPNSSSVFKGETLRDTIKIISGYADIIVMRNPLEGAAYAASLYSRLPLINAGDGGHLHPTQTMTDMFTIRHKMGRCTGLDIGLCGDLFNGRTVHSLIKAFSRYEGNTFRLISTSELQLPDYINDLIRSSNNKICEASSLEECISDLDILYMTRIQRERFSSEEEYRRQSGVYILTSEKMKAAKEDMIVLHPLPKVDEISYEVDDDPRAKYFDQAENGLYVRMALLLLMCEANPLRFEKNGVYPHPTSKFCENPRCITNHEGYLPCIINKVNGIKLCAYCESRVTVCTGC